MRIPQAFYIAVGDELTSGRQAETNGEKLARRLAALGCELRVRCQVPDREDVIARTIELSMGTGSDLVVVTGGLGTTQNDRTREAVARALGVRLVEDAAALAAIEKRYRERGLELPEGCARQALRPDGTTPVPNPVGTAPGFVAHRAGTLLVVLPGVPRECETMFERTIVPELRALFAGAMVQKSATLRIVGLSEAEVDRIMQSAIEPRPTLNVGLIAQRGEVEVMVSARDDSDEEAAQGLERALAALRAPLGDCVYGKDGDSLVGVVGAALLARGWMMAVAESVSGGLLSKRITDVPGSSQFFTGGVAAYRERMKLALLDVPADMLESRGAASGEVALAMAEGARQRLGVEVAVATTGIAGPSGGTSEDPVGLVHVAVVWPDGARVVRHLFAGNRNEIRSAAAAAALDEARRALAGLPARGRPVDVAGETGP